MERYATALIFSPGMSKAQCDKIVEELNKKMVDGRQILDFSAQVERFEPRLGTPILYTP